jgi:hypothetical protein
MLTTFLSSTAFRWLAGEVVGFFKAKQEHKHEIEMARVNMEIAAHQSELRRIEIESAADAGVKIIEAKSEAHREGVMDDAWLSAVQSIDKPSGIKWVDAFNKFIRPELAQISIFLVVANAIWPQHVILTGIVGEVVCGALGLFIGGRISSTGR